MTARAHPILNGPRRLRKCIWELTRACNLRCIHCENRSGPVHRGELTDKQLLGVADQLAALGCFQVDLTGGEPLLRKSWGAVARRLSTQGVRVALVTNGTLLGDEMLDVCEEAGVVGLGISVDGLQKTHNGIRRPGAPMGSPFDSIAEAIPRALRRLPVVVLTQVNQWNLGELDALGRWLHGIGVRRWQIQLAVPLGRLQDLREPFVLVPEQLGELARFLVMAIASPDHPTIEVSDTIGYGTGEDALFRGQRLADGRIRKGVWTGCRAGLTTLAITYEGKVRGCSALPPELDVGNLHRESLAAIWQDSARFEFTLGFHADRLSGSCRGCGLGPLCRGGCPTVAYWSTGTLGDNPYCLRSLRGHGAKA